MQRVIRAVVYFAAVAVAAQQEPSSAPQLPEVTVTAGRLPGENLPATKTPANVTVITRDQIEQSGEMSVPEMLTHQAGLQNIDTTGFGLFSVPNMRGFGENSGTLVLVDGVRMNDPGTRAFNALWPSIPPQNIERIEIIRGGGSTIYGEGAIGGVINIITKHDAKKPFSNFDVAFGNFSYARGHADGGTPAGRAHLYGSATYEEGDGARVNSRFYMETAQGNAGVTTAWGDFDIGVYYHKDRLRNPDVLTEQQFQLDPDQAGATNFIFDNEITRLTFDWRKTFESGFAVQLKPYVQKHEADSIGWVLASTDQPSWGATLQLSHTADALGGQNVATVGGEFIRQEFSQQLDSLPGGFPWSSFTSLDYDTASFFLQDAVDVIEPLRLQAGLRFDSRHYDMDVPFVDPLFVTQRFVGSRTTDAWSPGGGAVWSFSKTESAYFNISRSFSLPLASDIASMSPQFFSNPQLQPVDATNYELGFRWNTWRQFSGSIAFYHADITNDILLDPFTFQNDNFDETRNGIELSLQSQPVDWLLLYLNYTLQDSRFDGSAYDGNQIPQVPVHLIAGGVAWMPVKWFRWSWDVVHARDQVPTNDFRNQFERNAYTSVNTKLTWMPWKWGQVFLAFNNVLDDRYETFPTVRTTWGTMNQVRYRNPMPGLAVQGGVSVKF